MDGVEGQGEGTILLKQVQMSVPFSAQYAGHNTVPQRESYRKVNLTWFAALFGPERTS